MNFSPVPHFFASRTHAHGHVSVSVLEMLSIMVSGVDSCG